MGMELSDTWKTLVGAYRENLSYEWRQERTSHRAKVLSGQKQDLLRDLIGVCYKTFEPGTTAEEPLCPDLLTWLAQPCNITPSTKKTLTNAQFLAKRRTAWPYFFLQIAFISLTFPLSLIALAIASWITRDTWQFWKTNGQLLIEKLSALTRRTPPMYPDAAASESSTDLSITGHSPQQIGMRLARGTAPTPLRPGQALAAAIIRPEGALAGATGLPTLCSPDPVVSFVPATTNERTHSIFHVTELAIPVSDNLGLSVSSASLVAALTFNFDTD